MYRDLITWYRKVLAPLLVSLAIVLMEDVVPWISLVDRKNEEKREHNL